MHNYYFSRIGVIFHPDLVLRQNCLGCTHAHVHLHLSNIVEDYGIRRDEMVTEREDRL